MSDVMPDYAAAATDVDTTGLDAVDVPRVLADLVPGSTIHQGWYGTRIEMPDGATLPTTRQITDRWDEIATAEPELDPVIADLRQRVVTLEDAERSRT
jgi:hypothetical protein